MAYFLIAVSNRENLQLCLRYAVAGFTSSANGLWAFVDVQEDDFVSFLYGARVFNLYRVANKAAYKHADKLPPWRPVTFQPSGRTYYFPFRLGLQPVRTFEEPLVRAEFAYVAENLLLRGGYRKTHFQADQTTLQAISEMGRTFSGRVEELRLDSTETFTPCLTTTRANVRVPEVFLFREVFLQALVRRHLSSQVNLRRLLSAAGVDGLDAGGLEVMSEKAFPEGHVDLLIKEATPRGISRKVVVETKMGAPTNRHTQQLSAYMQNLGEECLRGVLVSRPASQRVRESASEMGIAVLSYSVQFGTDPASFDQLLGGFAIVEVEPGDGKR